MFKRIVLLFIVGCFVFSGSTALAVDMQEGKWEITMEMKGMPVAMPPMKHVQCLTRENLVPQEPNANQECTFIKNELVGNTVSWIMECDSGEGPVESSGEITYKGDRFDGVIETTMNDGGRGEMQMTNVLTGRRIGPCD